MPPEAGRRFSPASAHPVSLRAGLGPVGITTVPEDLWPPLPPARLSPDGQVMLHQLCVDPQPASPAFAIPRPHQGSTNMGYVVLQIAMVPPSPLSPAPTLTRAQLPQLLCLREAGGMWWVTRDLYNLFWSLHLPSCVCGQCLLAPRYLAVGVSLRHIYSPASPKLRIPHPQRRTLTPARTV